MNPSRSISASLAPRSLASSLLLAAKSPGCIGLLACAALFGCAGVPAKTDTAASDKYPEQPATLLTESQQLLASLGANRPLAVLRPGELMPKPSNDRDWIPELKTLARAEFKGDQVTIYNVRNAEFLTYRDCIVDYYDKTYDLNKIQSVDFIVIPFTDNPAIAHTMLSFGFGPGEYVGVSAEVRLERGETYDAAIGLFGQFELTYVIADERDLIRARTEHRNCEVYVYRTKATPDQARKLFVDVLKRNNQLRDQPEFYDTLRNNCTTNIVRHINAIAPNKVPHDYRILLPGFADRLAYELKLIDTSLPFEEVKRRAHVNALAHQYKDDPHFSARIRGETVPQ